MKRRDFIIACSAVPFIQIEANSKLPTNIKDIIQAVQNVIFNGDGLPSAREFRALEFLERAIYHKSFDRDIRKYIIDGALKFQKNEGKNFLSLNSKKREEALREFEKSGGDGWISRIMVISLEALLSDPIYGGNYKESGWIALDIKAGEPRPKSRYIFDE